MMTAPKHPTQSTERGAQRLSTKETFQERTSSSSFYPEHYCREGNEDQKATGNNIKESPPRLVVGRYDAHGHRRTAKYLNIY